MEKEVNLEYVLNYLKEKLEEENPSPELMKNMHESMKKYGDNHWWESEDKAMIGFYQLNENRLIVPFSVFQKGLEKLLDRPVLNSEMGINRNGLVREADEAINLYLSGVKHSDEYRQEKIKESMDMLEDFCKKNGKQLLKLDLSEDNEDDGGKDESGIDNSGYDGWSN